ncbi:MAG: hypothetical protein K0Q56_1815 [Sporolactobacillus laevolacticus]|jgi:hypothetical protein|nr:hypothetical protein [Sporolactobacillus laevolacticus]
MKDLEKQRDRSIDILKILLVIGMILCHCIMLLKLYGLKSYIVSEYFNAITFSGFYVLFWLCDGHRRMETTMNIYTHVAKRAKVEEAGKYENYMKNAKSK